MTQHTTYLSGTAAHRPVRLVLDPRIRSIKRAARPRPADAAAPRPEHAPLIPAAEPVRHAA